MLLNEQLKKLRLEHNYTQEDIAKKIGISKQSVSKWELGKTYPDIDNLVMLSDIYGITIDELIREDIAFKKRIKVKRKNKLSDFLWASLVFTLFFLIKGAVSGEFSLEFSSVGQSITSIIILIITWFLLGVFLLFIWTIGSKIKTYYMVFFYVRK